ncbi:MAG: FliM/FliN family flagellar motor switch protein [Oscillospiraceae bacterium]|nr:FliM/FliN family flagellar motor switch protein [Oscillospiraceae bacterium]
MAEVLSQSQIDALLAAAMSGTQDLSQQKEEKKYQKYDFRSPRKYTKERLKMLNGVFENYAKVLNTRINALARATCEVEVDTVDEQRYYEFSNALIDGEVVTLAYLNINDDIEDTPVIIVATPSIMVSLIDRLMGGAGDVEDDLPSDYTYTDLDLSLYQNLMTDFIGIMGGSWENYLQLDFDFGRIEANPTLVQLIGFEETVIMVSLDIKFSNSSGRLDICLPDAVLSKIFTEINKGNATLRKEREDHSEEIYSHIQTSELEITAELGRTTLQLQDVYNLNVGDVIDMNMKKDSTVSLRIGGREWFAGYMGTHEKHIAVKIRDVRGEPRNAFAAVLEEESEPADVPEGMLEPDFGPEPELDEGGSTQEDGQ